MTHAMAQGSDMSVSVPAVRAVLRWTPGAGVPDVDACVILLDDGGRVRSDADFVFYNQPRHPSGLARKLPKKRQGEGLTDSVEAQLTRQDPSVDRMVLIASADGGTLGRVRNLRVELHDAGSGDAAGGEPFAYVDIQPDGGASSALICGELRRAGSGWQFRAVTKGYATGLVGVAGEFGISVDETDTGHHPTPDSGNEPASEGRPAPGAAQAAQAQQAAQAPQSPQPAAAQPQPAPPIAYGYPPAFTLPPQGPQFIGR
ncbi:TerD family protein [Streptomyces sp. B22F1]|uniref:TerD family protein n=1 Tax=Streptomyces sp. B22F1 TaxID=3153566 RepID=UPI00325EA881